MKKILFVLLLTVEMLCNIVAQDLPYGVKFHYPTEYGNITIYDNYIMQDDKKIKSTIKTVNGYHTISNKDAEYVTLNCIVGSWEFVSLFKKDDRIYEYGLWEIPYTREIAKIQLCLCYRRFHLIKLKPM